MKKAVELTSADQRQILSEGIELGKWMGRREAFGLLAGRCTAADVETLHRIREGKLYRALDCTWAEYCVRYLHVSRRSVDRAIGYLEEFGTPFFHVAQMTHIGPKEYRAISQHITDQGVDLDGTAIALLPENTDRISAAIAELLERLEPEERPAAAVSLILTLKRCRAVAEALQGLPDSLNYEEKLDLREAVAQIRKAASALGIE